MRGKINKSYAVTACWCLLGMGLGSLVGMVRVRGNFIESGSSMNGNLQIPNREVRVDRIPRTPGQSQLMQEVPFAYNTKHISHSDLDLAELYRTIGDDGRLTWGVKELAGLSEDGAVKAQAIIDDSWSRWMQLARERTDYLPSQSDPDALVWVYTISSFREEGAVIWMEMQDQLRSQLGEQSAAILIKAFAPHEHFSSFGSYDARYTHHISEDSLSLPTVGLELSDPDSGVVVKQAQFDPYQLPRHLRGLLKFPPEDAVITR